MMYSKSNPFLASIKDRYNLCKPGSHKNVFHVVLDLKSSGITYAVGDSIAVFSENDNEQVNLVLRELNVTGEEQILDKQTGQPISLRVFLKSKGDITQVSRKLISEIAERQTDPQKKLRLQSLFLEEHKEALKEFQATHELWDTLAENPEVQFTPQEMAYLMQPLLPRFYSVASSMEKVGEEVHLTVAELQYTSNGHLRRGVCTHYLCRLASLHQKNIPLYVQPHRGFTLPDNPAADLIMVGPGTGIAPFRAFMQEREKKGATGKNWLFFGECHRDFNYLYEEDWLTLEQKHLLKIETAFSRDQDHKIYVQHRLLEKGEEIFNWLKNGAYFFVCGDALRMAKDVESALHQIVEKHGHMSEVEAKQFIKQLRSEKRYLKDVY